MANLSIDMPGTGKYNDWTLYIDYDNSECQVLNFSCMQVHVYATIVLQTIVELAIDIKDVSFHISMILIFKSLGK